MQGLAVASGGDVDGDSYDNVRRRDVMLDAEEQQGRMVKAKAKSLAELTREATEAAGKVHEADQLLFDRMMVRELPHSRSCVLHAFDFNRIVHVVCWMQKRRAKIENLQQEIARIRAKEGEAGLSEGKLVYVWG